MSLSGPSRTTVLPLEKTDFISAIIASWEGERGVKTVGFSFIFSLMKEALYTSPGVHK